MHRYHSRSRRQGASLVEFAVVCPVTLLLLFAIIVGGLGVFRYQQVAALARSAARWASVHGAQYAQDKKKPAATATDIKNMVTQGSVALKPELLSCSVTWNSSNRPLSTTTSYEQPKGNTVTVTVSYQWIPEVYLAGPITLTSSSTAQMLY